jgi:hypothetical protein
MSDKADFIAQVCGALLRDDSAGASAIASAYPFVAGSKQSRKYSAYQMLCIFIRDGFVDRYSGERLVFPGTLRLLSRLMPTEFPAHPNWKMTESHLFYWELFPTIDHEHPVARTGPDDESNWVTTSMLRNSAKSNWTLEELGWTKVPPGDFAEWDGLLGWFIEYIAAHPVHLEDAYIRRWHRAAVRARRG